MRPSPSQCYFSPRFHSHCLNAFNVLGGPLKSSPPPPPQHILPKYALPTLLRECASVFVWAGEKQSHALSRQAGKLQNTKHATGFETTNKCVVTGDD